MRRRGRLARSAALHDGEHGFDRRAGDGPARERLERRGLGVPSEVAEGGRVAGEDFHAARPAAGRRPPHARDRQHLPGRADLPGRLDGPSIAREGPGLCRADAVDVAGTRLAADAGHRRRLSRHAGLLPADAGRNHPRRRPPWSSELFPERAPSSAPISPAIAKPTCTTSKAGCTSTTTTTRARSSSGARGSRCAKISATTAAPRRPTTAASTTASTKSWATKERSRSSPPPRRPITSTASGPAGTAKSSS